VVDRPPETVPLAVDLHKHLIEVPPPVAGPHPLDPTLPELGCKHRTELVPPEMDRFVADLRAAFVQDVLGVPE
jgi:hypothetical protein